MTDKLYAEATQYTVSVFSPGDPEFSHFRVTVEWRSPGLWAIKWWGEVWGRDGKWSCEPLPSSREDEWKAEHNFTLEEALPLAREIARNLEINGHKVMDVFARMQSEST